MLSSRFENLKNRSFEFYQNQDPSHDWLHIQRVMANCRNIAMNLDAEKDSELLHSFDGQKVNFETLMPAALLHDLVNLPKNSSNRSEASAMAADKAMLLLQSADYNETEIQQIRQVIIEHSFSRAARASSLESAILQDADKLDALGAIGVMRTVTTGARMASMYYDFDKPFLDDVVEPSSSAQRSLNDKAYTIDHFFVKLLKLASLMNTDFAKKEAARRKLFMQAFLEQLKQEITLRP